MENENEKEGFFRSTLRRMWWSYLVVGGFMIGFYIATTQMQNEAIRQDFAHYDQKNGSWTWNDKVIDDERQEFINQACKALGSKAKNDPQCILMGVGK